MTAPTYEATASEERPVNQHLQWMRERGLRASTVRSRLYHLLRLVEFFEGRGRQLGLDDLLALTKKDLTLWRTALSTMLTPGAQACYISQVRGYYRWAAAEKLLDEDPTKGLTIPRIPRRVPRPIPEGDLLDAVRLAPARVKPMLMLAGWAGLRACEIAQLQRADIDLESSMPTVLVADGKGGRQRVIPLHPHVIEALHAFGLPRAGWLFPRMDGRPGQIMPWLVSQLCNNHLHSLGIDASLHSLRHRFGTKAYQGCQDLRVVQELMGHAWPSTTSGYVAYSHAMAVAAVGALPPAIATR
jgi:integrase/recombinase XerC